ncbi:MAG: hypothetical protein ACF8XB_06775 [Planctomycetota bacterium JB042]
MRKRSVGGAWVVGLGGAAVAATMFVGPSAPPGEVAVASALSERAAAAAAGAPLAVVVPRRFLAGSPHEQASTDVAPDPARIDEWIANLADDGIRWNALDALGRLAVAGPLAREPLERALDSRDPQQRQLAASLLRDLPGPPSDRLLEVTVEGLADDALPNGRHDGRSHWTGVRNAQEGVLFLRRHPDRARPLLLRAVHAADEQQAFCSALLLAYAGEHRQAKVYEILISRLADNDVTGDALAASNALYRLGRPALDPVVTALSGARGQQRDFLEQIVQDLTDPPRSREELRRRSRLRGASELYHDPVIEYRLGRPWPGF